jgi:dTDP-glucose 4,6-dehydratase
MIPKQRKPDITKAKEILGLGTNCSPQRRLENTYEYFKSLPSEEWSKEPKEFVSRDKIRICKLKFIAQLTEA